jgi:hypothetical protein
MKSKHAVFKSLVVLSLLSGTSSFALAQATAGAGAAAGGKPRETIELDVRAAEKLSPEQQQAIKQYVTDWTAVLADNSNPQQQSTAREKLAGAAGGVGNKSASGEYLTFYAAAVNEALKPLVQTQDVRTRLLAGIVAARVAERVNNTNLEEVGAALLNDNSDAVALWGMRTARYVIPWILRNPMQDRGLVKQVVPAVQGHANVPMIADAYSAFDVGTNAGAEPTSRGVARTLELVNMRVQQYLNGIPDDPGADAIGTTFMTREQVWKQLKPDQRVAVVQGISDLLAAMGQRAAAEDRANLPRVYAGIQPVAAALVVIANNENASALRDLLTPLTARITPTTTGADTQATIQKIYPAIQAIPAFAAVKPPPGAGGAPASASAAPAAATQNAASAK